MRMLPAEEKKGLHMYKHEKEVPETLRAICQPLSKSKNLEKLSYTFHPMSDASKVHTEFIWLGIAKMKNSTIRVDMYDDGKVRKLKVFMKDVKSEHDVPFPENPLVMAQILTWWEELELPSGPVVMIDSRKALINYLKRETQYHNFQDFRLSFGKAVKENLVTLYSSETREIVLKSLLSDDIDYSIVDYGLI
jgi:hypothetical protein